MVDLMFKRTAKRTVRLVALVAILPIYFLFLMASIIASKDQAFAGFSQFMSLFPGKSGNYLRAAFYKLAMQNCFESVTICFGSIFSQQQTQLASGIYIGPQCNIGKCHIEENCLLGSGVHIMSGKGQHNFSDINTPIQEQGGTFEAISIGEDCWIGNGAIIMANIGKKCVIGAGSVVINDIPDYSIAVGNPAKVIKHRKQ